MEREHHFYVAIAKHVFFHEDRGLVMVRDPIKLDEAERYGLSPALLYGTTVVGLPLRSRLYSRIDEPMDLGEALEKLWTSAEWLRGPPDKLRVSGALAENAPDLVGRCSAIGIEVCVAGKGEKSLPAAMRAAQTRGLYPWREGGDDPVGQAIAWARIADEWDTRDEKTKTIEVQNRLSEWQKLEARPKLALSSPVRFHSGSWLSSWEASVPPARDRYFHKVEERNLHEGVWYLLSEDVDRGYDGEVCRSDDRVTAFGEPVCALVKSVVANWPRPIGELAGELGTSVRSLQWFMNGKAKLDFTAWDRLERLLTLGTNEFGDYEIDGPLVLIARKERDIEHCWSSMTCGGDSYPLELVPSAGEADPSWRYFLVNRVNDSQLRFVIAPRGSVIADRMEKRIAMNFRGRLAVPTAIYSGVVEACGVACRSSAHNSRSIGFLMDTFGWFWDAIEDSSWGRGQLPEGAQLLDSGGFSRF